MPSILIEAISAEISDELVLITIDLGDEKIGGVMRRSSFRELIEHGRLDLDEADRRQCKRVVNLRGRHRGSH